MKIDKPMNIYCLIAVFLMILTACQIPTPAPIATSTPSPEPSPSPTVKPTEAVQEWLYVAFGDSTAICCGSRSYPSYYAEFIGQDLNVKVRLYNMSVGGSTSDQLLRQLEGEGARSVLAEAQVVTVVITLGDIGQCRFDGKECLEKKLVTSMENYKAILERIIELTSPGNTIIRTQSLYNPFMSQGVPQGDVEDLMYMFEKWNNNLIMIAGQYNVPIADVYRDFNGPDGSEDPIEKGYIASDNLHINDNGARRIAELLCELGFKPLAP
jgi:lysophospholipase L1-like esterase